MVHTQFGMSASHGFFDATQNSSSRCGCGCVYGGLVTRTSNGGSWPAACARCGAGARVECGGALRLREVRVARCRRHATTARLHSVEIFVPVVDIGEAKRSEVANDGTVAEIGICDEYVGCK